MTTSHRTGPRFSRSRWFLGFLVFLAVSIYMLLTEHRGHYLAALPLVLLATCVIAHVLMHRHAVPGDGSKANPPFRWFQWWCPDWSTDFGRLRSSDWRAGEPSSSPRGG